MVKSEFFDVYKWSIHGTQDFEATADYMLVSILEGKGQLTVADKRMHYRKATTSSSLQGLSNGNFQVIWKLLLAIQ